MTEVKTNDTADLKQNLQKRFTEDQDKIEAIYKEMAGLLMAEVSLDILEKVPAAKTLVVEHLTEEYNEYNSVVSVSLLNENGTDLFDADDDGSLQESIDDILINYSADYLILLPETIDLQGQLNVLSD